MILSSGSYYISKNIIDKLVMLSEEDNEFFPLQIPVILLHIEDLIHHVPVFLLKK